MYIIDVFFVSVIRLLNVVGRIVCIVCGSMICDVWWLCGSLSVVVVLSWFWLIVRMLLWIIFVENVV